MTRSKQFFVWLALGAMTVAPVLLAIGLMWTASARELQRNEPAPLLLPLAERDVYFDAMASARGKISPPNSGRSHGAPGTVTQLHLKVGDTVSTGIRIARVGDRHIVAYRSDQAFHRPLSLGDRGWDVELLQLLLPELGGGRVGVTGRYDRATRAAVMEVERLGGTVAPSGRFDPLWFMRIPQGEFTVARVLLDIGTPYPAAGSVIVESLASLESVAIEAASFTGPDGDYTFAVEGLSLPLVRRGNGWQINEPARWQELLVARQGAASGSVRLTKPEQAITLPPSSIVTGREGELCVLTPDLVAHRIEVVTQDIDVVAITTELSPGREVVVNPGAIAPGSPCP